MKELMKEMFDYVDNTSKDQIWNDILKLRDGNNENLGPEALTYIDDTLKSMNVNFNLEQDYKFADTNNNHYMDHSLLDYCKAA